MVFCRQAEFPGKTVVLGSSWKELHSHKMGLVEGMFSTVQLQVSEIAQI